MQQGSLKDRVEAHFRAVYRPGELSFHSIVTAVENPQSGVIAVAGSVYDDGGFPTSRIALLRPDGSLHLLNADRHNDMDPSWSPDGNILAFLSDRDHGGGNFQLHLADVADTATQRPATVLHGQVVESFRWSRDGTRVLLQAADAGADAAGSASFARVGSGAQAAGPSWAPSVSTGHDHAWRRAHVWHREQDRLTTVGEAGRNVWEAAWCGPDEIVAIVSASPTEGGWYETELAIAPASGGAFVTFASPERELGMVSASPDGAHIAVAEGRFHRGLTLGGLVIYDRNNGDRCEPDVGAEVSTLEWRDDTTLFFAGFAAPGTVVGDLDIGSREVAIRWRSSGTAGRKVPSARAAGTTAALIPVHAFDRYPCLLRVEDGQETTLLDLATPDTRALVDAMGPAHAIRWQGRDGLDILGYLALPAGVANPPLVTIVHGGPSHLFRDAWMADNPIAALLVRFGYAVLCANPRGSSGRGVDFAERVIGDWGGEDRHDILAGIDYVVANHAVDATRLYVMGGSYGGYMTSWLVTQTDRFRAACAIVPLTDMRSFFFTAHHPEFLAIYTRGGPYEVGGIFDDRSPLRHADKVATPTLLIAGGMDNTTPSTQASQFHRALVLRGVETQLIVYPEEGHSVTRLEAQVDQGVRILEWFGVGGGTH